MTEARGSGAHQAVAVGGGAPARRRGHLHHETDQMVWLEGVGHGYNESLRPRYLFFFPEVPQCSLRQCAPAPPRHPRGLPPRPLPCPAPAWLAGTHVMHRSAGRQGKAGAHTHGHTRLMLLLPLPCPRPPPILVPITLLTDLTTLPFPALGDHNTAPTHTYRLNQYQG